jgi:hypothetical protein
MTVSAASPLMCEGPVWGMTGRCGALKRETAERREPPLADL